MIFENQILRHNIFFIQDCLWITFLQTCVPSVCYMWRYIRSETTQQLHHRCYTE